MDDFDIDITSDEFMEEVEAACIGAREEALREGHPVVFKDEQGRYVQEYPDGRLFEIRFDSTQPRDSHIVIVRELSRRVA